MKTRRQIQLEANRKWVATNPAKVLYNGCRSNAKRRGLEFTISFDDVQALTRHDLSGLSVFGALGPIT